MPLHKKRPFPDCYYYSQPRTDYQWSSTSRGKGKLNFKKALRQSSKPWKIKDRSAKSYKKKKIIVTDYEILNVNSVCFKKSKNILKSLLDNGFEIYFINNRNNQFIELTSLMFQRISGILGTFHITHNTLLIKNFFSICMKANQKIMEKWLTEMKLNKDHYFILDHYASLQSEKDISSKLYNLELPEDNYDREVIKNLEDMHQFEHVDHVIIHNNDSMKLDFNHFKRLNTVTIDLNTLDHDWLHEFKKIPLKSYIIETPNISMPLHFHQSLQKIRFDEGTLPFLADFSEYANLQECTFFNCNASTIIFPPSIKRIDMVDTFCQTMFEKKDGVLCNISKLRKLEYLQLSEMAFKDFDLLGSTIAETTLRELQLGSLNELVAIPELPASLKIFSCSDMAKLEILPTLAHTQLEELLLYKTSISSIPALPSHIKSIECRWLSNFRVFPDLQHTKLEMFYVEDVPIKEIPHFPNSLQIILGAKLSRLESIPDLSATQLIDFHLTHVSHLKKFPDMPISIKNIELEEVTIPGGIPDLDHTNLLILVIKNCDIKRLGKLPSCLKTLILDNVNITALPELKNTTLKKLIIKNINYHLEIPALPSTIKELQYPTKPVLAPQERKANIQLRVARNRELEKLEAQKYQPIDQLITHHASFAITTRESHAHQSSLPRLQNNIVDSKVDVGSKYDTQNLTTSKSDAKTKDNPYQEFYPKYSIYRDIHKDHIPVFKYRHFVQDLISIKNDDVIFSQSEQKSEKVTHIKFYDDFSDEQFTLKPNQYVVHLPELNVIDQWFPLAGLHHDDKILSMAGFPECEIQYVPVCGQYKIKLSQKISGPLFYIVEEHGHNKKKKAPVKPILSDQLQKDFEEVFSKPYQSDSKFPRFEKLKIKINELKKLSTDDRAKKILQDKFFAEYFNFDMTKDIKPEPQFGNSIIQLLVERQGVCRHRSSAYMALCHYLEIPARKIINDVHEMVEIYCNNHWYLMDLGGGTGIMNKPPAFPIKRDTDAKKSHVTDWRKYFSPHYDFDPADFNQKEELLDFIIQQNNIAIPVSDMEQAQMLYDALITRYQTLEDKETQKEVFYLESTEDIENYLELLKTSDTEKMDTVPGPLKKVITESGILVINWGGFSHDEVRSYKSILDKTPTFLKIPSTCKVINLIPENTPQCETLFSRSKKLKWPSHISFPEDTHPIAVKEKLEVKNFVEKDLYGDPDEWQNSLLGTILVGQEFIPGVLQQTIESGKKGIQLYDAPLHNANFCAFIKRLLVQREFYSNNGDRIKLPEDFKIHFAEPQPIIRPDKIRHCQSYAFTTWQSKRPSGLPRPIESIGLAMTEQQDTTGDDIFYLSSDTLPELINRTIIQNGQMKDLKGFLYSNSDSRKKVIIQTEVLSPQEERRFFDAVSEAKDVKSIDFYNVTDKKFEVVESFEIIPKKNTFITTEDPVFITTILENKLEKAFTFQIMNTTEPGEIIENVDYAKEKESKQKENTLQFEVFRQEVANLLIKGEAVILHGTLSYDLYRTLEPMFGYPPKLSLLDEDNPVEIKGQLIVVTTPTEFPTILPQCTRQMQHVSRDMLKKLYLEKFSEDKDILQKIYQFYDFAEKISHGKIGMPDAPALHESRIRHMLAALKDEKNINDNPIKPFFLHDYDKDSEAYAKLNVFAKYLFGNQESAPAYREKKLKKCNLQTSLWSRANCFNAKALQTFTLDEIMNLSLDKLTELQKICVPSTESNAQKKNTERMHQYLDGYHGVVLKGPPGSGKTYLSMQYARDSKNHHIPYFGEDNILKFLESQPKEGEESILVIDEANLKSSGFWDFLSPIFSTVRPCEIQYHNKSYSIISNRHKVIFTCNPESYPGRDYHALLQALPTVYVEKWTNENLKELVIKPFLAPHLHENKLTFENINDEVDRILQVYEKMPTLSPSATISLRDLMQVLRRYVYHLKNYKGEDCAYHACMTEWFDTFSSENDKLKFKSFLNTLFLPTKQSNISENASQRFSSILNKIREEKDFYLCDKTVELLAKINEDIDLANQNTDKGQDGNPVVKSGILIEGRSGIGKSASLAKLLTAKGYTTCTAHDLLSEEVNDLSQRYFQFTVSPNDKEKDVEILQAAFDKGCKVILDELDVGTELEEVLNQLLTGKSVKGEDPKVRGFYLLASQNGNYANGTKALAKGLINRLHVYQPDELTRFDLFQLAQNALSEFLLHETDIQKLVEDYLSQKTTYPDEVNTRTFLEGLKQIKNNHFPKVSSPIPDHSFDDDWENTDHLYPLSTLAPNTFSDDEDEISLSLIPPSQRDLHSLPNNDLEDNEWDKLTIRDSGASLDCKEMFESPKVEPLVVKRETRSALGPSLLPDNGLFRSNLKKSWSAPELNSLKTLRNK